VSTVDVDFESWAMSFSGCDGGDIGSPTTPSIWFCGIEWGGAESQSEHGIRDTFSNPIVDPPKGYDSPDTNFAYIFNWQALKLLAAIHGYRVEQYKEFGRMHLPFVDGSSGFFKLNLFPFAFKDTSPEHWSLDVSSATGFPTKQDYLDWVRSKRLPILREWARKYVPKLIVCVGSTYSEDFRQSFGDQIDFSTETIEGKVLQWTKNISGTVVAIVPFMVNRNGLTRNVAIQAFGDRIRNLLA